MWWLPSFLSIRSLESHKVRTRFESYSFNPYTVVDSFLLISEFKSEKTMEALKKLSSPTSHVIRGSANTPMEIPSSQIVPGDLVLLTQGDKVPAGMLHTSSDEVSLSLSLSLFVPGHINNFIFIVSAFGRPAADRSGQLGV